MTIDVHVPLKFLQNNVCLLLNKPLQINGNSKRLLLMQDGCCEQAGSARAFVKIK